MSTWSWISYYAQAIAQAGIPIIPFSKSPHWSPEELGDQRGKVILITGGNSGTGYQTARQYYAHGAKVYIGCRSPERAAEAIENIKKGGDIDLYGEWSFTPVDAAKAGSVEFLQLDLADLESVGRAAKEFNAKEQRLDVLFANAGVMASPVGMSTVQGYALQFGTNVLGHQRFIAELLPLLSATSRANPSNPARLISLASLGQMFAPKGGIDYDALRAGGKQLDKWAEYGLSKWGNVALAKYVDTHYGPASGVDGPIIAISVHPGVVATNLARHVADTSSKVYNAALPLFNVRASKGTLNQLWAGGADVETARKLSGHYVACYQTQSPYRPDIDNAGAVDKLWDYCTAQWSK
ncbi:putative oxidoreductase [Vanrija pseudolonga]|uniref:Purtative oxidoreductase n=1 Tax=Vanrija pseudolonga TaxID=143232 RepID=A0AAF1BSN6_9TREE|nr:purtative oxidoreductase [Vanrija pseudolonga]